MVSMSGYLVSQYVFYILLSYILLFFSGLALLIKYYLLGKSLFVPILLTMFGELFLFIIYYFPIKLGFVFGVNGFFAALSIIFCKDIIVKFFEDKEE